MDFRKQWFQNCILNYLGETDAELMNTFLGRNDNDMGQKFDSFLNDQPESVINLWNQVFVVYKTYYSKMVEEEIEVQEEVAKQRSSSLFGQDDKKKDKKGKKKKKGKKTMKIDEDEDEALDELANLEDLDADYDEDRRGKKSRKGKSGGRGSPSTMIENVSQDEYRKKSQAMVSYVTVKKKVQKVVQLPQLQGYFGVIDPEALDPNITYVYFIKKFNRPVPNFCNMDEAVAKMPSFLVVGSMTGDVLENVERLLNRVFIPLFRNRITATSVEDIRRSENDEDVKFDGVVLDRRPSYYFIRKLKATDESSKHLLLDAGSSVSYHLQHFFCPTEDTTWKHLLHELLDLIEVIQWARNELQLETQFVISDSLKQFDWQGGEIKPNLILTAKETVEIWMRKIDSDFSISCNEVSTTLSLLEEYEYWRATELKLSSVVDEIDSQQVVRIVNLLKNDYCDVFERFQQKRDTLHRAFRSAQENVEILQPLQYFFKILVHSDFKTITTVIPTLIVSLKSVWILSSYYSKRKHMERILISIKNTLCNRVKQAFDVTTLFKATWNDIHTEFSNVILMLQSWKTSYLEVRSGIESTKDFSIRRWEFEKQKLFAESEYISTVIRDMQNIFQITRQYENLLNSKFKTSIQSNEYETLKSKIIDITAPIEKVDFDVYLEIFRDEWQEVLDLFEESVTEIDQRLKLLTIKAFSKTKSVSEIIEAIEDISKSETRSTVQDSLPFISNKLISQFEKEITITDQIFEKNKFNGTHPYKVYDFVCWAKDLVNNLESTIVKFEKISELCSTTTFGEIVTQFNNFKSKVNRYVDLMVREWSKKTILLFRETLKRNVLEIEQADKLMDFKKLTKKSQSLKLPGIEMEKGTRNYTNEGDQPYGQKYLLEGDLSFGALALTLKWISKAKVDIEKHLRAQRTEALKKIEQAHKISWLEYIGNSLLIEKGFRFKLKLQQSDLLDAVKDAEKLQQNGFKLQNEILEFLALKTKLFEKIETIKNIVSQYNSVVAKLEPTEMLFMKRYFLRTEMSIQPGLTLYTWRCTVLDSFRSKADRNLQKLLCLQYQMKKIFEKLDLFVTSIENMNFLPLKKMKPDGLTCQEFFEIIAKLQLEEVENCLEIYEIVSLTLIQCESLILQTNSGKSSLMTYFYDSYSEKIYNALKKSLLKSMDDLQSLFRGELPVYFLMTSHLENDNVTLEPTCDELFEFVKITLVPTFIKLKFVKEWEDGSCVPTQNTTERFYQRLINDEEMKEKSKSVLDSLNNLCNRLTESMKHWRKYDMLWEHDKDATISKLASKKPQLSDYEAQFDFYSSIASKIEQEEQISLVCCVKVEVAQLMDQLKNHCTEWKNKLGFQLAVDTKQVIRETTETIRSLYSSLNSDITDEQILTDVLTSINEIENISVDVSIKFYKIEEHFHELRMQNLKVVEDDVKAFNDVKSLWEKVYDRCLFKKFVLESVKTSMTNEMKVKLENIEGKCDQFVAYYRKNMNKLLTSEFDATVRMLTDYSKSYAELSNENVKAEQIRQCFEIPGFQMNDFVRVKSELEELKFKFKLL